MDQAIMVREKSVYIFMYDDGKRVLSALAFLTMIILGLGFMCLNQWVTLIFGGLVVVVGICKFVDACFFKRIIINKTHITKEWLYFGKRSIKLSNLQVGVVKGLGSGTIFFHQKDSIGLNRIPIQLEVLPIGNTGFNLIRKILIQKGIITGDELSWNNS